MAKAERQAGRNAETEKYDKRIVEFKEDAVFIRRLIMSGALVNLFGDDATPAAAGPESASFQMNLRK